jgi:putative ABC transport system ATP-binding protein
MAKKNMARLESIDFVKGLAITGIIFFHCYEAIYGWPGHDLFRYLNGGLVPAYTLNLSSRELALKSILKLTGLGYQGVSVFVVLSGFLQVWSSKKNETPDEYVIRRFLRIFPLYWMTVIGVIILNLILQRTSGVLLPQLPGVLMGWAPLLPLNPSFWFMSLIIQLYFLFPYLHRLLNSLGEKKFLLLSTLFSVLFLLVFANIRPWAGIFSRSRIAGIFFGCWLIEFSIGMVMANHFSKVNSMLGVKTIVPMFLGYVLGLYLTSSPLTWPLGRPLYGVTLTLFLWSLYNIVKTVPLLKKPFVFIGLNSFALFLINQPFIQEFFVFVTRLLLPGQQLQFRNLIIGSPENFLILPINKYLPLTLSYLIIAIFASVLFTNIDKQRARVNPHLNKISSVLFFERAQETLDVRADEVVLDEDFLIEATNVSKVYRIDDVEIKALSGLDFRVARRDFISIMGPSGSGKTTLLNIVGGLDKTTSGSVYFDGEDLTKLSETRLTDFRLKNVGFIFQQYNLLDVLSALENVELPTIAAGVREEEAKSKAVGILESVGLKNRLYNRPTQLSGGEQQRVAIARALINDPSLIIADEPTGNVDSETGLKLIELLCDLNRKEGVTIILATHDLQIAQRANRLVRMKDGKII